MTITRAKATRLLNATEMGLYDDSRANAMRGHTESKLARLITRARTARDRARDLEKRQRLASRSNTGSKSGRSGLANARTGEKAVLLADIMVRLEARQKDNAKSAKAAAKVAKSAKPVKAATSSSKAKASAAPGKAAAAPKRAPATTVARGSTALKKAVPQKPAAKSPAVARRAARKTTATKVTGKTGSTTAARKASVKPAPASAARAAGRRSTAVDADGSKDTAVKPSRSRPISPARALKNTRALLALKDAETAQGKTWEELGGDGTAQAAPGYQSGRARTQALALHAAETRQASINGSVSTRDRRNQGKRDHRNKPD